MAFSLHEKFFLTGASAVAVILSSVALNDALMRDNNRIAERPIAEQVRAEGKKLMENRYGFAGNGVDHTVLGYIHVHEKYVNASKHESCTVNGTGRYLFGKVLDIQVGKPVCQPW